MLAIKLLTVVYITIGETDSFEATKEILLSLIKSSSSPKLKSISIISLCLISVLADCSLDLLEPLKSILENDENDEELIISALTGFGLIYHFNESSEMDGNEVFTFQTQIRQLRNS